MGLEDVGEKIAALEASKVGKSVDKGDGQQKGEGSAGGKRTMVRRHPR